MSARKTRLISCNYQPPPFTGKERDEETGYGYFGARYMDHELMTMWLSVDPMADKYPAISPYAYCAWNPVKLVDPDGRDVINTHTNNVNELKKKIENIQTQINNCTDKKQLRMLNKALKTSQNKLKIESEYEDIVNSAIQDLKDYGIDDEFNKLDNLTDVNGNNVDVFIQVIDYINQPIGGTEGQTDLQIESDGSISSKKGKNTVSITLSHNYKWLSGKILAHEGGHVLWDVRHPTSVINFYALFPTQNKNGHESGNNSGLVANYYEDGYVENRKRAGK